MLAWVLPLFTLTRVPFSDRPHVAAEDLPYAKAAASLGADSKTMAALSKQMQKCTKGSLHSEIIAALEHNIGTALVIGANTGNVRNDPAFAALNTSACAMLVLTRKRCSSSLRRAHPVTLSQTGGQYSPHASCTCGAGSGDG